MTLNGHYALCYAVLWLSEQSQAVGDGAVRQGDDEFLYRVSIVTTSPCATVWPQFSMQGFNVLVAVFQKRSALPSDNWASCCKVRHFQVLQIQRAPFEAGVRPCAYTT